MQYLYHFPISYYRPDFCVILTPKTLQPLRLKYLTTPTSIKQLINLLMFFLCYCFLDANENHIKSLIGYDKA